MDITSLPYLGLLWTGVGFLCILVGFFIFAYHENEEPDYTSINTNSAEELFAYFLEEEEKKNDALRQSLKTTDKAQSPSVNQKDKDKNKEKEEMKTIKSTQDDTHIYKEIEKLYNSGVSVDEIAKKLNKGKGEIQLMISLYSMR